jgi:hypothetical protein
VILVETHYLAPFFADRCRRCRFLGLNEAPRRK